ncbi:MAG: Eco29kI family restriction endonuclease [Planctomycetes bacterium]|nr:Eco29kI family restriction endonuclease [Planctomycetota bacterium]
MSDYSSKVFDPLDYHNIADAVVRGLLERMPQPLADVARFPGAGIYALYYLGDFEPYLPISDRDCSIPIYVGKAIPPGARKGADRFDPNLGEPLYRRLKQHAASINDAENLQLSDFRCRHLRVQHIWIALAEQVLVQRFRPLWNTVIDGFGNHPPGRGRRSMRRPRWDIIHPGRDWALDLTPQETAEDILREVAQHLCT